MRYRGRFAPSPTGPLHFGSIVTALGSWLDARANQGEWLVRIEDLDTSRNLPGAEESILRTLEECGLWWDCSVLRQSERFDLYEKALAQLKSFGQAFPCACTRKEIGDTVYPGTCRSGVPAGRSARAWRLRIDDQVIGFRDRRHGWFEQDLAREVGDFVVRRADGVWAYQLAVVVDDEEQGVTDVVRGGDLLDSTPRQILLQRLLGYRPVRYMHLPVAVNEAGLKLSKQTLAPAAGAESMESALEFLGLCLPSELKGAPSSQLLRWATSAWHDPIG